MSSRSLAAARSRRSGDPVPPVSGNRPITSIGSVAQQMPSSNNVRVQQQQPQQQYQQPQQQYQQQQQPYQQQQQPYQQQQQQQPYQQQQQQQQPKQQQPMPFTKLSVSDAVGLITLRLGRVEQWIIETNHENEQEDQRISNDISGIPENHKVIDTSVLTSIVNRLDSLETTTSLIGDVKTMTDQIKRISDDVSKHTNELSKNTEAIFRFNRELVETKDILKSFMIKYDLFTADIATNFSDYESALTDIEKRLPIVKEEEEEEEGKEGKEGKEEGTQIDTTDTIADNNNNNIVMNMEDLKNISIF